MGGTRGHRGHPYPHAQGTHGLTAQLVPVLVDLPFPPHLEATGKFWQLLPGPQCTPIPLCHRGALPGTRPWSLSPHLLQGQGWGEPCLALPPHFRAAPARSCPECPRTAGGQAEGSQAGGWWCRSSVSPAGRGAIRGESSWNPAWKLQGIVF